MARGLGFREILYRWQIRAVLTPRKPGSTRDLWETGGLSELYLQNRQSFGMIKTEWDNDSPFPMRMKCSQDCPQMTRLTNYTQVQILPLLRADSAAVHMRLPTWSRDRKLREAKTRGALSLWISLLAMPCPGGQEKPHQLPVTGAPGLKTEAPRRINLWSIKFTLLSFHTLHCCD